MNVFLPQELDTLKYLRGGGNIYVHPGETTDSRCEELLCGDKNAPQLFLNFPRIVNEEGGQDIPLVKLKVFQAI